MDFKDFPPCFSVKGITFTKDTDMVYRTETISYTQEDEDSWVSLTLPDNCDDVIVMEVIDKGENTHTLIVHTFEECEESLKEYL